MREINEGQNEEVGPMGSIKRRDVLVAIGLVVIVIIALIALLAMGLSN